MPYHHSKFYHVFWRMVVGKAPSSSPGEHHREIRSAGGSFALAVLVALTLRTLLFEPYYIPSGSMKSTLLVGDFIVVNKYAYGYSRHSLPFGPPVFEGRIAARHLPERGDIVVFVKGGTKYIKRLIGLPGDIVQMKDGNLFLNHQRVEKRPDGTFTDTDGNVLRRYIESLAPTVSYVVLDQYQNGPYDNTPAIAVPEGHYFFMGDNRDNSGDSRAGMGMIPLENIVGKASYILLSMREPLWKIWRWYSAYDRHQSFTSLDKHRTP
jgi:signal peptidase I